VNLGARIASLCFIVLLQFGVAIGADGDRAEGRVGQSFWARPGLNDTSVDFFKDRRLRERLGVYKKRRFRVTGIEVVDDSEPAQIIYAVKFEEGEDGFIDLSVFDKALYRELESNQVMTAPQGSPIGAAPHLWIFERSSIFASDPDVIWARIKNEGPRTFKPARRFDERTKARGTPKAGTSNRDATPRGRP
jgi:hypothetical protein